MWMWCYSKCEHALWQHSITLLLQTFSVAFMNNAYSAAVILYSLYSSCNIQTLSLRSHDKIKLGGAHDEFSKQPRGRIQKRLSCLCVWCRLINNINTQIWTAVRKHVNNVLISKQMSPEWKANGKLFFCTGVILLKHHVLSEMAFSCICLTYCSKLWKPF